MHQYYHIAKVAVVANVHHVKLLISIPLKVTAAYHLFTLHRIITCLNGYLQTNLFNKLWTMHF